MWLLVCLLIMWIENFLFLLSSFKIFLNCRFLFIYFFINLFLLVCQKFKNDIKSREIQNVWSTLLSFVSNYVLSCIFMQMALCIYKHSLFPMHLNHCGRNPEIFVTVVNRSSTLTWMISEWFCWSWYMHRLVSIYLLTLYFIVFSKKSSLNVNLQMKRNIDLQKLVAHTTILLGKRESDQKLKLYDAQKAKG